MLYSTSFCFGILDRVIENTLNFSYPVMDVASGDYGDILPQLVSGVDNGRLIYNESSALLCTADSLDTEGSVCSITLLC